MANVFHVEHFYVFVYENAMNVFTKEGKSDIMNVYRDERK